MGTQQELTTEQISVLLWIKALNDFKDADCPDDTLDDKIMKFDLISAGISSECFKDSMQAFENMEIISIDDEDQVYRLTTKGKALMVGMSAIKNFSDETVKNLFNGSVKAIDFAKEHKSEIIGLVFTVLNNIASA